MPYKEKACGFISGKKELQNWSKTDLFQFFYDTKPIFGNLADITEPPSLGDIQKNYQKQVLKQFTMRQYIALCIQITILKIYKLL